VGRGGDEKEKEKGMGKEGRGGRKEGRQRKVMKGKGSEGQGKEGTAHFSFCASKIGLWAPKYFCTCFCPNYP